MGAHSFVAVLCAAIMVPASPSLAQTARKSHLSEHLSFQDVNAFAQDSLGYMWIATLGGLNRYNGYAFEQFLHNPSDSTSLLNDFVFALLVDSSDRLWIGTARGVCRYDFESETFVSYPGVPFSATTYGFFEDHDGHIWTATPQGPGRIETGSRSVVFPGPEKNVNLLWEDRQGHLWMGMTGDQGLAVNRNGALWDFHTLPGSRSVTCIYVDPQGIWWLGTNEGVILFDPANHSSHLPSSPFPAGEQVNRAKITFIKEVEPLKVIIGTETDGFYLYDMMAKTLSHNTPARFNPHNSAQLHNCFIDRQKNVWIGTYDKGIAIGNKQSDHFNQDEILSGKVEGKFVTRVMEDQGHNLWIGTRYNGLYRYAADGAFSAYKISDFIPDYNEFLEVVYIDSKNRIWIAFESKLIIATADPAGRLRIDRKLDIDNVRVVKEGRDGVFWLGSWNGIFRTELERSAVRMERKDSSNITDICILDSGEVLYASYERGIFRIGADGTGPQRLGFPDGAEAIARTTVTLYEDGLGRLWLGSYGNGLLCRTGERCTRISAADGLPNNNVLCFQEDLNGDIWASTSHGISRLKPSGESFRISNYYNDGAFPADQYHEKSGCRTHDGSICFGGNHGLTFFNPSGFQPNSNPPLVHIEDLKIFNQSIRPAPQGSVLKKSLLLTDGIVLNHRQRTISLDYAGIDFYTSNNLTYKYKLEGFDKRWNDVGTHRRASYSNIPPGDYTFLVTAINEDGVESAAPARLNVIVKSAPWFTWRAWTAYSFIVALLAFFILRSIFNARLNRQRAELERSEKEREKEISKMKITFFTNISHELRTPLTLISAPLEKLLNEDRIDAGSRDLVAVADRNAHRMLQLINQLMDSVKIENGVLSLNVKKVDIISLLEHIHESFRYRAEQKKIDLVFSPHVSSLTLWADADKIEKILYNLLSNAINHTPGNGKVMLDTFVQDEKFVVSVSDTGEGIPPEKLDGLFVRYRKIEGSSGSKPDYSGSGIGLHYTRTLVEKHKGQISARLRPEGGMVFSFTLPLGDAYSDKEKEEGGSDSQSLLSGYEYDSAHPGKASGSGRGARILVVEDNVELKEFLVGLLSRDYRVRSSTNGREALDMLKKEAPDLILSDVIMPGLSGYDLCASVKQDPEFCHIPVVLLTAKTSMPEQVEGLESGADVYICKPFSIDYLQLAIKNLLHRKELLQRYFSTPKPEAGGLPEESLSGRDKTFLDRLTKLLEEELDNPDLNVDQMALSLGFSRTALYHKIKGLTGLSPNDFVRNYRFKCAGELLLDSSAQLVEIAERTGFSSYSYFSKAFKQHFGVAPKAYRSSRGR